MKWAPISIVSFTWKQLVLDAPAPTSILSGDKIKLGMESNTDLIPGQRRVALKNVMAVGVQFNEHFHPLQKLLLFSLIYTGEQKHTNELHHKTEVGITATSKSLNVYSKKMLHLQLKQFIYQKHEIEHRKREN